VVLLLARLGGLPSPRLSTGPSVRLNSGDVHALLGKGTPHMRVTGTVKFFNAAKGYGFVQPDDGGKDVFVHATALEQAGIRSLNEGDKITFVLEDDRRGRGKQAGQIQKA
jgi:CspA family cold shock protein